MSAALRLFADLGITFVPPNQQHRRGPLQTSCCGIIDRMIRKHGLPHATITLRTITESSDANGSMLIADVILGISDVIAAHPRWPNLGLEWLAAFDQIDLAEIRKTAKAVGARPLQAGIATLIGVELMKTLGPSRLPKPPKPVRVRLPPKPPRALTRVAGVQANVKLGAELLALRATTKSNRAFGRAMRAKFGVDAQLASEAMKVARLYAGRDEIVTRLSWDGLVRLSSKKVPAHARQEIEAKIVAGEKIVASDIVRARGGALKPGRPRRKVETTPAAARQPAGRPAMRVAA